MKTNYKFVFLFDSTTFEIKSEFNYTDSKAWDSIQHLDGQYASDLEKHFWVMVEHEA